MQRAMISASLARSLFGLLLALAPGCAAVPERPAGLERFEYERPLMGTSFRLVFYASAEDTAAEAAQASFSRLEELDALLSDYDSESELSRLGAASAEGAPTDWIPLSEELYAVLEEAQALARASAGAFDVTVGPYVRLWRRARRQAQLPSDERLAEARARVGYERLELDPERRAARLLVPDMRLDLGGIAKGYALDEVLVVLRAHGIERALVDGGGDLLLGAPPPGQEGWSVAVEHLEAPLMLARSSLCTSGDAYQHVELDGVRYSHLIDPLTGGALTHQRQVSVIATSAMQADALASALSVLAREEGEELARVREAATAVLRLEDGRPVWRLDGGFERLLSDPARGAGRE